MFRKYSMLYYNNHATYLHYTRKSATSTSNKHYRRTPACVEDVMFGGQPTYLRECTTLSFAVQALRNVYDQFRR